MDTRTLQGKTVLITGAASGIGRATAMACARRGARLMICDLNEAALEETVAALRALGATVSARRIDVARREEVAALAEAVHAEVEAVDLLINNAGVAIGGGFLHTTLDDWDWIVSINLLGVVYGCHFFIPPMLRRGRGHVVNIASSASFVASSALAAYSTTKFAVLGLSEALREELAPNGVGVTAVCPGLINTPITRAARLRGPADNAAARQRLVDMYAWRNYGPERVADGILRAVRRNRAVAPIAPEAWTLYYIKRFAPWLVQRLGALTSRQMLGRE
jgi:NAD(P)-dependent dehydrogenase (short-subunit alcohol dehydrogenase family)